jgi:hypothetical protein
MSPAEKSAVVADHKERKKGWRKAKKWKTRESSNATENKKEATLALASHEQKKNTNH